MLAEVRSGGTSRDAGVTLASLGLSLVNNFRMGENESGRRVNEMGRNERRGMRRERGQDLMCDRNGRLHATIYCTACVFSLFSSPSCLLSCTAHRVIFRLEEVASSRMGVL